MPRRIINEPGDRFVVILAGEELGRQTAIYDSVDDRVYLDDGGSREAYPRERNAASWVQSGDRFGDLGSATRRIRTTGLEMEPNRANFGQSYIDDLGTQRRPRAVPQSEFASRGGVSMEHEFVVTADNGERFAIFSADQFIENGLTNEHREYGLLGGHISEIVTSGPWQGRTVEKAVNELKVKEKAFIAAVKDSLSGTRHHSIAGHNTNAASMARNDGRVSVFPLGTVPNVSAGGSTQSIAQDYSGSFHVHFTSPKGPEHLKEFGKAVQWLEPLYVAVYGSPNVKSFADRGKHTEGSFRLLNTQWGKPGASDPERLSDSRGNVHNAGSGMWNRIHSRNISDNPGSISGGDLRNPDNRDNQLELRFFDSFDIDLMPDVARTFSYALANVDRQDGDVPPAGKDAAWQNALVKVFDEGYNAWLPKEYIDGLKDHLNLDFEVKSLRAVDVLEQVAEELHKKNKDSPVAKALTDSTRKPKVVPVNQHAFDYYMKMQLRENWGKRETLRDFLEANASVEMSSTQFKEKLSENSDTFVQSIAKEDVRDILDWLEFKKMVTLDRAEDGKIDSVKLKSLDKFDAAVDDESFMEERVRVRRERGEELPTVVPRSTLERLSLRVSDMEGSVYDIPPHSVENTGNKPKSIPEAFYADTVRSISTLDKSGLSSNPDRLKAQIRDMKPHQLMAIYQIGPKTAFRYYEAAYRGRRGGNPYSIDVVVEEYDMMRNFARRNMPGNRMRRFDGQGAAAGRNAIVSGRIEKYEEWRAKQLAEDGVQPPESPDGDVPSETEREGLASLFGKGVGGYVPTGEQVFKSKLQRGKVMSLLTGKGRKRGGR